MDPFSLDKITKKTTPTSDGTLESDAGVEQKTTLQNIALLHRGIKSFNLMPLVDSLRDGSFNFDSPIANREREFTRWKRELFALGAYFTEQVWQQMEEFQKNTPLAIARYERQYGMQPISVEDFKRELAYLHSRYEKIENLAEKAKHAIQFQVHIWGEKMYELRRDFSGGESKKKKPPELLAYTRCWDMVAGGGLASINTSVEWQLHAALDNAMKVIWGLHKILPTVYKNSMGKEPNRAELSTLWTNNINLILALASADLEVFFRLKKLITHEEQTSIHSYDFNPNQFEIRQTNGSPALEIKDSVFSQIPQPLVIKSTEHLGCTAMYARASGKQDVMRALYFWNMRLAEEFSFPNE